MKATVVKSLDNGELAIYLAAQLNHFFPDRNKVVSKELEHYIDSVEKRAFNCFSAIEKKYFNESGLTRFNHLHSDQYCMYLYMLANH
ncbi:MAG: serine acetyltransferase, partial [Bacteroidia bacterium]